MEGTAAVGGDDGCNELKRAIGLDRCEGAEGHLASAAERVDDGTFRGKRVSRRRVVDGFDHSANFGLVARLDGDDALSRRGHTRGSRQRKGNATGEPKPVQSSCRRATSASCSPLSSFLRRVSRLPRIGVKRAAGNSRVSCANPPHAACSNRRRLSQCRNQFFECRDTSAGPRSVSR